MSLFSGDPLHVKLQENIFDMGVKPMAAPATPAQTQMVDLSSHPMEGPQNIAEGIMSFMAGVSTGADKNIAGPEKTPEIDPQGQELLNNIVEQPDAIKTGTFDKGASEKATQNELRGVQVEDAIEQRKAQLADPQATPGKPSPETAKPASPEGDSRLARFAARSALEGGAVLGLSTIHPAAGAGAALVFGGAQLAQMGKNLMPETSGYKSSFDRKEGGGKGVREARPVGPSEAELRRLQDKFKGSSAIPQRPADNTMADMRKMKDLNGDVGVVESSLTSEMQGVKLEKNDPVLARLTVMARQVQDYRDDVRNYVRQGVVLTPKSADDARQMGELNLNKQLQEAPDNKTVVLRHNLKAPGIGGIG